MCWEDGRPDKKVERAEDGEGPESEVAESPAEAGGTIEFEAGEEPDGAEGGEEDEAES